MAGRSKISVKRLDFGLLMAAVILMIFGIVSIASATHFEFWGNEDQTWYVKRQGWFILGSLSVAWFSLRFDYRFLKEISPMIYGLTVLLLLLVMFVGQSALGAQRWLQIGPISIQPSEFAKLAMIIVLGAFLADKVNRLKYWSDILPVFLVVGIPAALVLKQPDLGTALVFFGILMGTIFVAGIPWKKLGILFGGALLALPVFWHFLHDYQKSRLLVLLDPMRDPLGAGYHVIQSQIAVGSGRFFGKGLFYGPQSQLNFLPENHTDFIFSVVGEELGFIGSAFLILVYGYLLYRSLRIAGEARDDFGMMLATGIASMWAFQLLVNVGMTIGVMPVTGIPLPFVSYGLSSLLTNIAGLAILQNIYIRHRKISF